MAIQPTHTISLKDYEGYSNKFNAREVQGRLLLVPEDDDFTTICTRLLNNNGTTIKPQYEQAFKAVSIKIMKPQEKSNSNNRLTQFWNKTKKVCKCIKGRMYGTKVALSVAKNNTQQKRVRISDNSRKDFIQRYDISRGTLGARITEGYFVDMQKIYHSQQTSS